jgi:DNA-binding NarL/FixJ family response regulator
MPRRRVLLVDDHQGFVESARALLSHEGMQVVAVARTAVEAIQLCGSVRPDVMLLDIHLPDRSGVDVAHAVSRRHDAPQMVLISSDADAATHPDVLAAPVCGFVHKRDLSCAAIEALLL